MLSSYATLSAREVLTTGGAMAEAGSSKVLDCVRDLHYVHSRILRL